MTRNFSPEHFEDITDKVDIPLYQSCIEKITLDAELENKLLFMEEQIIPVTDKRITTIRLSLIALFELQNQNC